MGREVVGKVVMLGVLVVICGGCPSAALENQQLLYRVNCGSQSEYTDESGAVWQADQMLEEGKRWGAIGGETVTREMALTVQGTRSGEVYRTERYGLEGYEFELPNGVYRIRLHFAETFEGVYRAGMRAFDVKAGERDELFGVDPFGEGGGFARAVVKEIKGVRVRDGRVRIEFVPRERGAVVNGIEIFRDLSEQRDVKRILFIGNSNHMFWALPETVEAMVNTGQGEVRIEVHRSLSGGKDLAWHYDKSDVVSRIRTGDFDYVALQEGLKDPVAEKEETFEYAMKFDKVIKESDGKTLLFVRWAKVDEPPGRYDEIIERDVELAEKLGAILVPIGAAWQQALRERPGLVLYNPDGGHPGMHGAYLNACVYYAVLTGWSPEGYHSPAVLGREVKIDMETALFLERVAWETVKRYRPLTLLR